MNCDECGEPTSPRRSREVSVGSDSVRAQSFRFCIGCHSDVFRAADWRKYPALFDEVRDWAPALGEWQLAAKVARLLDLTGKGFAQRWHNNEGEVLGIRFERVFCKASHRWLYRGIEEC